METRRFFQLLTLCSFLTCFASCSPAEKNDPVDDPNEDPTEKPEDKSIITIPTGSQAVFTDGLDFDYMGTYSNTGADNPVSISFNAADTWYISPDASYNWLTISPLQGMPGDIDLKVSAMPNTGPNPVSAVVTIVCGDEKKSFTVTVKGIANYVPVEKIRVLGATSIYEMLVNETVQLSAAVAPDEASLPWVRWSSSDPNIASITDDGFVTAKTLGVTDISASADGVTSTIEVRVVTQKSDVGEKASYNDFIGRWTVTGTEHEWFEKTNTYSYDIQIEADEEGKSYLIYNWETAASEADAAYLYYGSKDPRSIYQALSEALGKSVAVKAWYDADKGQLHIDRQTYYTNTSGVPFTVEFLGDVIDVNGHTSEGSWLVTPGDRSDMEYTICDFVMQADGSVNICTHRGEGIYDDIAFMGYAKYEGYPWSEHYNAKFAFPYKMVKNPVEYKVTSVTISESSISMRPGTTYTLTATALPESALNKVIYWSSSDDNVATVAGGIVKAVGVGTATLRATASSSGVYAECTVTVSFPNENGHEYVDLGLPSGIMWATCNIGAENGSPSDYGSFYAWGEISTKSEYTKANYLFYGQVVQEDQKVTKILRYCTNEADGTADGRVRLDPADDAARQAWGGRWRIPTRAEWEELLNNTSWSEDTFTRTFTNRESGASITIRKAGFKGTSWIKANSHYYWTSELKTTENWRGYVLWIGNKEGKIEIADMNRELGTPIRAVFDPNASVEP